MNIFISQRMWRILRGPSRRKMDETSRCKRDAIASAYAWAKSMHMYKITYASRTGKKIGIRFCVGLAHAKVAHKFINIKKIKACVGNKT